MKKKKKQTLNYIGYAKVKFKGWRVLSVILDSEPQYTAWQVAVSKLASLSNDEGNAQANGWLKINLHFTVRGSQ